MRLRTNLSQAITGECFGVSRAAVERTISHLKNWKIPATGYRRHLRELPRVTRRITHPELHRLNWQP